MTERTDYQATQPRGRVITDPKVRAWIYGVAIAVGPLLIAYGILDNETWPLWSAVVGAILVPGLAALNTPAGYVSGVSKPADRA